jgi:ER membrane protein complex subunit 8/9
MALYNFTSKAYAKAVLHAAKYPSVAVFGVFLGTKGNDSKENDTPQVVDTVPLFHGVPLAAMMEIALTQVDEYCRLNKLEIMGCYFANKLLRDREVSVHAKKIGVAIAKQNRQAFIAQLDNTKLGHTDKSECGLFIYKTKNDTHWSMDQSFHRNVFADVEKTTKLVNALLDKNVHHALADFDDHLDDVSQDWLNVRLFKEQE